METVGQTLDIAWILICAALVMLMQAGFSCLESGFVRSKNSINVAAKNFADFCLSSVIFWLFGFGLLFGMTAGGFSGTTGFLFNDIKDPWLTAFFIFQLGFCGTATTIISGAVAERMRFGGYLIVAAIVSGVIYPFIGHWVWGSAAGFEPGGWLEQLGFIDFAGSTVVHSVGGWVALAAIIIIGPRLGRFGINAVQIHGHDLPFVTLGVFLLWFGWFGFNGGSTLALTSSVPAIIFNTTISGAFGGIIALGLSWRLDGRPDVAMIMNGSLAGLVGITASANIMSPMAAVGIGSTSAVIMYFVTGLLDRFEIDDVVGVVPVHLAAGIWGTLAVAIFADPQSWGSGLGRWDQFVVQATGVGATFVWAFGLGFSLLWVINRWIPLRIDPDGEQLGLNIAEHGASTEILDLLTLMGRQRQTNDFTQPVPVEPHTEIGQIAQQYNMVLADINEEHHKLEVTSEVLRKQSDSLQLLRHTASAANRAKSIEEAVLTCLESICAFGDWHIGHCFMIDEQGGKITSAKIWHLDDKERFAEFRKATEKYADGQGASLANDVLTSGKPTWLSDLSGDENYFRAQVAKDVGIRGAAAFPVLVGEEVVAVLEFFTLTPLNPNDAVLEVMASVGAQLGRVVERARSAEARFKTMADNMPANMHLRDKNGQFILVNRKYEEFYGITNDAARGKTIDEVEGNQVFEQVIKGSKATDREVIEKIAIIEHEFEVMADDGPHTLTDRFFPITDSSGEVIEVGSVEIDITELKRTEEALLKSKAIVNEAVKIAQLGHWIWDEVEDKCIYCSTECARIHGYSKEEYLAHMTNTAAVVAVAHPEDRNRVETVFREAHMNLTHSWSIEYRIVRPDGVVRYIRGNGRAVFDEDGQLIRTNGTVQDITKRKRAEEELQKAHEIIKNQKERMEDELNIGREIQMSMVPLDFPAFPDHDEFTIFATLEPAREVGGDFYDFYFLDAERLCICIGDVAGKGVPSALFMAMAKALIKSRADDDHSTASILTHVNDELSADNRSAMFVTIFSAIINIRTGEFVFTNAGHNPPYIKRADGTLQRLDQRHGPVIGALEGMVYKEDQETMTSGDMLVLFTDGVTEAMNGEEQLFSEDRYIELLERTELDDPETVIENTLRSIETFTGEADQTDDITILALKYFGTPEDGVMAEQHIVIKNELPEILVVNEKFETFVKEFDIPQSDAMKFNIIFDELLHNVMLYAYTDDDEHDIEVKMERIGKRLTVTISDDGVPFNPLRMEQPDTDLSIEEREIGGMGIHLVRNLIDNISYQRRIGKNVMTMMQNL